MNNNPVKFYDNQPYNTAKTKTDGIIYFTNNSDSQGYKIVRNSHIYGEENNFKSITVGSTKNYNGDVVISNDTLGLASVYQPKGDYATISYVTSAIASAQLGGSGDTPSIDLTGYLTKSEATSIYQPKGDYATTSYVVNAIEQAQLGGSDQEVNLDGYLTKDEASSSYQPKGDYLTTTAAANTYATKTALQNKRSTLSYTAEVTSATPNSYKIGTISVDGGTAIAIYGKDDSSQQQPQIKYAIVRAYIASTSRPGKPVGGSYDFSSNYVTLSSSSINNGWKTGTSQFLDDDVIWMSIGQVYSDNSNNVVWEDPIQLTADKTISQSYVYTDMYVIYSNQSELDRTSTQYPPANWSTNPTEYSSLSEYYISYAKIKKDMYGNVEQWLPWDNEGNYWTFPIKCITSTHNEDATPGSPSSITLTESEFNNTDKINNVLYIVVDSNNVVIYLYYNEVKTYVNNTKVVSSEEWESHKSETNNIFYIIKDNNVLVGYGLNGVKISIPNAVSGTVVRCSLAEYDRFKQNDNISATTIYFIMDGNEVVKMYLGETELTFDSGVTEATVETMLTQMFSEKIKFDENNNVTNLSFSEIDVDTPGMATLATGLHDYISDSLVTSGFVTQANAASALSTLFANYVKDDSTYALLIATATQNSAQIQSVASKITSNGNIVTSSIVQSATNDESVISLSVGTKTETIVWSNGVLSLIQQVLQSTALTLDQIARILEHGEHWSDGNKTFFLGNPNSYETDNSVFLMCSYQNITAMLGINITSIPSTYRINDLTTTFDTLQWYDCRMVDASLSYYNQLFKYCHKESTGDSVSQIKLKAGTNSKIQLDTDTFEINADVVNMIANQVDVAGSLSAGGDLSIGRNVYFGTSEGVTSYFDADGYGYLANGKITWDANGNVTGFMQGNVTSGLRVISEYNINSYTRGITHDVDPEHSNTFVLDLDKCGTQMSLLNFNYGSVGGNVLIDLPSYVFGVDNYAANSLSARKIYNIGTNGEVLKYEAWCNGYLNQYFILYANPQNNNTYNPYIRGMYVSNDNISIADDYIDLAGITSGPTVFVFKCKIRNISDHLQLAWELENYVSIGGMSTVVGEGQDYIAENMIKY